MKTTFAVLMSIALFFARPSIADVVIDWNEAALDAIRASNTTPPAASRNLAILHAAIYDAVNGIRGTHEPYLVGGGAPRRASVEAAGSAAAHDVLIVLYPGRGDAFEALHATIARGVPRDRGSRRGSRGARASQP